ncbi:ceramide synthase 1-like [Anneissia japonica]|uniref:ceramide synthase 1-like n=1 Tax=Anneissia japonica TaxID=1529436 RepID=UPI00142566C0|nr:ceramide synthase 1-like [Anneissia japonica]
MSTDNNDVENWPEIPGYWEVTKSAFLLLKHELNGNSHGKDFISEIEHCCSLTTAEVSIVLLGAVLFTIGRFVTSKYIFIPWAKRAKIPKRDESKVPESAYKSLFYTSIWFIMLYIIFGHHEHIFRDPVSCFTGWQASMAVPIGIRLVYGLQASFYVHSVFATLYMDTWRKDSYIMLIHHFLTLSLVGFSYASRYHNIGLLVFFLHDITDVFLENSKLLIYFKIRRGKKYPINDQLANVGFAGFSLSWFVCRLYWFPLKALWSASKVTDFDDRRMPFVLLLNSMLWVLLVMNIWWFTFILSMLYKVITGQSTEIDDIREEDIVPSEKKLNEMLHVGNGKQNGIHSKSNGKTIHNNGTTLTHRPTAAGEATELVTGATPVTAVSE